MTTAPLLASVLAGSLILPAQPAVYVPPRPAIIKPENLEFSKHLLAMPLTMGMLAGNTVGPTLTLTYRGSGTSGSNAASYSTASLAMGTASATRLVIAAVAIGSSGVLGTVTTGGVGLTQNAYRNSSFTRVYIFSGIVSSGTSAVTTVTFSGTSNGDIHVAVYTVDVAGTSATPYQTQSAAGTTPLALPAITIPTGGVAVAVCCEQSGSSITWTNATENTQTTLGTTRRGSAASTSLAGSTVISATIPSASNSVACVASWGG